MYQKERDGYQERLGKVQDMLERATTENSTMKLSVHQFEIEKSRFITEIEHQTSRIEVKEMEVRDVRNAKSSEIERLEEKWKMAVRERESLAGQMESQTDRNRNTQRGVSDEKMLMVEENKRLKDELSRMEYQRNEHQANFNEADRRILESRELVEKFNERIKELEARLQETRAKNEKLNDELFQVKREMAEYQDGTRAPDNVYALQRENKDIAVKLREANIKIADLESDLQHVRYEKNLETSNRQQTAQSSEDMYKKEINLLKADLQTVREQNQELKNEIGTATASKADGARLQHYMDENARLQTQIDTLMNDVNHHKTQTARYENMAGGYQSDLDPLRKTIRDQDARLQEMMQENSLLKTNQSGISGPVGGDQQAEIDKLKTKIVGLQKLAQDYKAQCIDLKDQNKKCIQEMEKMQVSNNKNRQRSIL